jgi:hypothetical protein
MAERLVVQQDRSTSEATRGVVPFNTTAFKGHNLNPTVPL